MIDRLEPRLQYATISGVLWNDADSSQTFDRNENAIAHATAFLDLNANGSFDAGEPTAVTNAHGRYAFTGVAKGTYLVGTTEDPTAFLQTNVGPTGTAQGRFNINVTGLENATTSVRAAFAIAARHWESIITGDVMDQTTNAGIDTLTISAVVKPIDGVDGVLGQSDPTAFRTTSGLPSAGFMQFDSADLASLQSTGGLNDVILHEMGHVLGFGTIWGDKGLIQGGKSREPRYVGPIAVAQYDKIYGITNLSIPIENDGIEGGGTRDSHWKETVLKEELMTGFLESDIDGDGLPDTTLPDGSPVQVPLSRITVGQFADEGYQVNLKAADTWNPYTHEVTKTTALDIGGVANERQIRVFAHDKVADLDFGFHDVIAPKINSFSVTNSPTAVNRTVLLQAAKIFDGNGVNLTGVSFYRESNGIPGLQKGSDTFIGLKTRANQKVYSITAPTGTTAEEAVFYAYATDTGGITGHATRTVTIENVDNPADAPQNVAVRELTPQSVRYAFTDDSINVEGYRVELSLSNSFGSDGIIRVLNIDPDPKGVSIGGLTPGRKYYIRVRGFNAAGTSPFSLVTEFETI